MRRRTWVFVLAGLALFVALCSWGTAQARLGQGRELVMPGASDLRIEPIGLAHVHVSYQLPDGKTLRDLVLFLKRQGWQQITFPNVDRTTLSFTRPGWSGQVREILVGTIGAHDRRHADLQFGRCLHFAGVHCF